MLYYVEIDKIKNLDVGEEIQEQNRIEEQMP